MCMRFMPTASNVTGSADEVGLEAAGRSAGLVAGDRPVGTTSSARLRHAAQVAVDLAELTQVSVVTLRAKVIQRKVMQT